MTDMTVLSSCLEDRSAFEKVRQHVDVKELSPQAGVWYPLIEEYYQRDPMATRADRQLIRQRGERDLPEKHAETLLGWYDQLPLDVSPGNVIADLLEVKRHAVGNQLCAAIQSRDKKVPELLGEYNALLEATTLGASSEVRWCEDDDEMFARLNRDNLIKVAPQKLNEKLDGGAARGDHIVLFGRPEAGKTLMAVNMVAGFLKFGQKVLYVCNEEDGYKVRKRIISNLSGATKHQMDEEPQRALAAAKERGLDNLRLVHLNPGTLSEIEEIMEEVRPDVLVLDQIRNIDCSGDNLTKKLENLGKGVRRLLSKFDCVGLSITQAGDKTERHGQEPPEWLTMSDIDSSRTGLPAQADVILGVGVNSTLLAANQRAISLCKNKLNDTPDGRIGFTVTVDLSRSKAK